MNALKKKGIKQKVRLTAKRKIIADILAKAENHLTVEDIHERAKNMGFAIGVPTIYRTLKLFESSGLIDRHTFRSDRSYYEAKKSVSHDHLLDLQSGKIIEFHDNKLKVLITKAAKKLGYRLVDYRLELYAKPVISKKINCDG